MQLPNLSSPFCCSLLLLSMTACNDSAMPDGTLTETPASLAVALDSAALDTFITAQLSELRLPGVAIAIVNGEGIEYSAGYGWADVEGQVAMTPNIVLNIASISKTVTNVAVLQLRDRGLLALDDDVSQHLPFPVRHPAFPETPITVHQLLTHTSGITDGDAYDASYACGDPAVSLGDWIRGALVPGGAFYSAGQNYLPTGPGEAYDYSNIGYGLLGFLVEQISKRPFAAYVEAEVFSPLGMEESGWYLSDIEPGLHATPYAWVEAGETLDNALFGDLNEQVTDASQFVPFCPYSFYNIPDGLVRTSVDQLARYLIAHIRGGEIGEARILAQATVEEILSSQLDPALLGDEGGTQGLTWRRQNFEGVKTWGHSGADPGVRTHMMFVPASGRGVIVFANRAASLKPILLRLLEEATRSGDGS